MSTLRTRTATAAFALTAAIALGTAVPAQATAPTALAQGAASSAVADLQRQLNAELTQLTPLTVDGRFGPLTAEAVTLFQTCAGIEIDGVVGPQTRTALKTTEGGSHIDSPCLRAAN
ncbi:peptidoglycan-binding domain-containing protein [Kitasatospora sp. P5_F3]